MEPFWRAGQALGLAGLVIMVIFFIMVVIGICIFGEVTILLWHRDVWSGEDCVNNRGTTGTVTQGFTELQSRTDTLLSLASERSVLQNLNYRFWRPKF
jgi:hypothetical protein